MDHTLQLLQFSIYSKIIQEIPIDKIQSEYSTFLFFIIVIFFIYKTIPIRYIDLLESEIYDWIYYKEDECSIIIPYHIKTYGTYAGKSFQKTHYSDRFIAINHYLKKNPEILSLIEVMNFENSSCAYDCKSEFILLPNNHQKICICRHKDIYFEVIQDKIDNDMGNSTDEKAQKNKSAITMVKHKNYVYKLSKPKKTDIYVLYDFIDECVRKYNDDMQNRCQMIHEYTNYKTEHDDDKICMMFQSSPFISNKTFENIFFEDLDKIRNAIADFSIHLSQEKRMEITRKYKQLGIPFKKIILLHGPPGCGKSSLIKAIINETGRHCIFVPWSRMKTCTEFSSLFYDLMIERKQIQQKDVVYVFEDFDANQNDSIKKRKVFEKEDKEIEIKKEEINTIFMKQTLENLTNINTIKPTDELTLEYVLNILDGIKELNNTILIFTTNDIGSIDPAIIRPGRIDNIIEMGYASINVIKSMLGHFFGENLLKIIELDNNSIGKITPTGLTPTGLTPTGLTPTGLTPTGLTPTGLTPTGLTPAGLTPTGLTPTGLTPAKVQEICIRNKGHLESAIRELFPEKNSLSKI